MDIIDLFIQKNLPTENIISNNIKDLFQSQDNINKLSFILYKETYLSNNQEQLDKIKLDVKKYIDIWISTEKLDKLIETNSFSINNKIEQLSFYNKLFIDTFKNVIVNYDQYQFEINNNPYKHILSYKINSKIVKKKYNDLNSEDYQYLSFNNYNDKFNLNSQFNINYNKIPYYEKSLYKKNYDIVDIGSFRERKLVNNNYRKYNNNELLNGIDYLK